jgi:hypothetical protein
MPFPEQGPPARVEVHYRMRSPNPIRMTALVLPRARAVSFMAAEIGRMSSRGPAQADDADGFFSARSRVRPARLQGEGSPDKFDDQQHKPSRDRGEEKLSHRGQTHEPIVCACGRPSCLMASNDAGLVENVPTGGGSVQALDSHCTIESCEGELVMPATWHD